MFMMLQGRKRRPHEVFVGPNVVQPTMEGDEGLLLHFLAQPIVGGAAHSS